MGFLSKSKLLHVCDHSPGDVALAPVGAVFTNLGNQLDALWVLVDNPPYGAYDLRLVGLMGVSLADCCDCIPPGIVPGDDNQGQLGIRHDRPFR
jgi:hypothetical protein